LSPIIEAIGEHNTHTIKPNNLLDDWNDYLLGQLIVIEEMMNFNRGDIANTLKPILAAPPHVHRINQKHTKQFYIPNIQNCIIFTNREDALTIEDSDRRYWIHESCLDTPRSDAYYAALWSFYAKGGCEKVAGWLLQRDLAAFNPKAPPPMTEAKDAMIEATSPKQTRWAMAALREGGTFYGRELITAKELVTCGNDPNNFDGTPGNITSKQAETGLRRAGYQSLGKVRINSARTENLWAIGAKAGLLKQMKGTQIAERYLAETATKGKAA
ncbi:MAG: primase-helicase family protein, partial [Xanthobacteraceae bacterium]